MTPEEDTAELSDRDQEATGEDEQPEEISGWADSMSKILKSTKPKNKKALILSRARKDYEINKNAKLDKKKGDDIEIAREEGTNDKEPDEDGESKKQEDADILSFKQQRKLELRQRKLELAWENLNRLTTAEPDREMETDLLKIATKGVVQLFNAVAQQQKTLKTKLRASSKSEFKKEKVLSQSKDIFDKAMSKSKIIGNSNGSNDTDDIQVKDETSSDEEDDYKSNQRQSQRKRKSNGVAASNPSKKPVWQALQDDFMLSAKLKDWDKESDSD